MVLSFFCEVLVGLRLLSVGLQLQLAPQGVLLLHAMEKVLEEWVVFPDHHHLQIDRCPRYRSSDQSTKIRAKWKACVQLCLGLQNSADYQHW
jgi:hypothetical protein